MYVFLCASVWLYEYTYLCVCLWVSVLIVSVYLPVGESVNVYVSILGPGLYTAQWNHKLIPSSESQACPQLRECVHACVHMCCWLHLAMALRDRRHQACFCKQTCQPRDFLISPVCTGSAFSTSTKKLRSCWARFLVEIDRNFACAFKIGTYTP